ncbi:hypothetical protein [Rhodoblastus sphagnicola]|uniref:hypothetical protein n=1 Tax=Rhodoblastus sphagnicola TaxID=333368 RepID=UPI0016199BB0|nr:hypothetical protein [Rhodoblastus sphagnicola]
MISDKPEGERPQVQLRRYTELRMTRKGSELAGIAAAKLQTAKDEIIATGDSETIAWALDQFHQAEALLRRVMADCDAPSGEVKGATEAA